MKRSHKRMIPGGGTAHLTVGLLCGVIGLGTYCLSKLINSVYDGKDENRATTPNIVVWPQLDHKYGPQVNGDGTLLAASDADDGLEIWSVKDGQPGRIVWTSRRKFPRSLFMGYGWCGPNLVASRVTSSTSKIDSLTDEQEHSLESSRGDTLSINPLTGKQRVVCNKCFITVICDRAGSRIAFSRDSQNNNYSIYLYDVNAGRFSGIYPSTYAELLGWDANATGIYIVEPKARHLLSDTVGPIKFVSSTGKLKYGFPIGYMFPAEDLAAPAIDLPTPLLDGKLSVAVNFYPQMTTKSDDSNPPGIAVPMELIASNDGTVESNKLADLRKSLSDICAGMAILTRSPNGRFLIIEGHGPNGRVMQPDEIWLVDTKLHKRRHLGTSTWIGGASQWFKDRLLVNGIGYNNHYGVIHCAGADLPADSPQLQAILDKEDWTPCPAG